MSAGRSIALAGAVALLLLLSTACGTAPTRTAPHPAGAADRAIPVSPSATRIVLGAPTWARLVPRTTTQVVRTATSDRWCDRPWCTITQAWSRTADGWHLLREFRSSISPEGWGKERQDDLGTPEGVFRIKVTFSTGQQSPGAMPWRRRLPTSTVTDRPGRLYNTWIEEPGRTDGARPSMRFGFVVDYNHVRLLPGRGPAPVPGAGSGIFYHTSRPHHRWEPSEGCTRVGDPAQMRWLLTWLRPSAHPRVVQDR